MTKVTLLNKASIWGLAYSFIGRVYDHHDRRHSSMHVAMGSSKQVVSSANLSRGRQIDRGVERD